MNDKQRKAMFAKQNGISKSELERVIKTRTNTRVDPAYGKFIANGYDDLKNKP